MLCPPHKLFPPAVGEEIEMTPMVFAKGLADAGYWGDKLFGRVVSEDMEVGAGFLRKACRARAIYGLEPVFESGHTCVIKVHNFIIFGTKNENSLIEKNYDITIQVSSLVDHHPPFSLPPSPPVCELVPRQSPALCPLLLFPSTFGMLWSGLARELDVSLPFLASALPSEQCGAVQDFPITL